MASKAEFRAEIRELYGNFLSQNQVREYLGKGTRQTIEWLQDVPYTSAGRKKSYSAIDIARKRYEEQQTAV